MIEYKPEHMLMIHLPYKEAVGRTLIMHRKMLLDGYNVIFHAPMTSCSAIDNGVIKEPGIIRVDFINVNYTSKGEEAFRNLVKHLSNFTSKIIWKCDMTGCKINGDCEVLDTWELDDGMC